MANQKVKKIRIKPQDFSDRKYYPGTPDNPFHTIDKVQAWISIVPTPLLSFLIGCIVYLISGNLSKAILLTLFSCVDWVLLSLLSVFRISFGPPALTTIILTILRMPFLLLPFPLAVSLQVIGTFLVFYGFYAEPQLPKVTEYHLNFQSLHPDKKKIRIVHISDLHMEYLTTREKRVINKIKDISPDLILFTGDIFNISFQHNPGTFQDIIAFFNQLEDEEGILGVTGSPSVDLEDSIQAISSKMSLRLLNDESVDLSIKGLHIHLIGLGCTHQPEKDVKRLESIIDDRESDINILLYHSPDIAPAIENLPIDLQLSGHTHGGQVQLPLIGPLYTNSLYGLKFSSGLYQVNKSPYLIISRGLGLEGKAAPRVRFLSPPEIGLITLEFNPDNVK